jgi:hypothetical protein
MATRRAPLVDTHSAPDTPEAASKNMKNPQAAGNRWRFETLIGMVGFSRGNLPEITYGLAFC